MDRYLILLIKGDCVSIHGGKLEEAIELLEEGRAVFWTQAMQDRSPMYDLEAECPPYGKGSRGGISRCWRQLAFVDQSST